VGPGDRLKEHEHEEVEVYRGADCLRTAQRGSRHALADIYVCWQIGISEATFYIWKKKYAKLGVGELRQMRQLT